MSWTLARAATKPERRRSGLKLAIVLLVVLALPGACMGLSVVVGVGRLSAAHLGGFALAATNCQKVGNTQVRDGADPVKARNAQTVATVGKSMGVSEAGLILAVATILVESGGRNLASQAVPESLNYPNDGVAPGDLDSVGLFQQRPSWGSVADRMSPETSARLFYQRLLGVTGWETMGASAAQVVQVSAYPDRYAGKISEATALVGAAPNLEPCKQATNTTGFTDGPITAGLPVLPRTATEAIAWARAEAASGSAGWYRRCLAFVANAYGLNFSGTEYAIDHFRYSVPPQYRHPADGPDGHTPEPGALLFWDTGSRAGHVALYLGGGEIASNDIVTPGHISTVPVSAIEKWGATFIGWTPGIFPNGG